MAISMKYQKLHPVVMTQKLHPVVMTQKLHPVVMTQKSEVVSCWVAEKVW